MAADQATEAALIRRGGVDIKARDREAFEFDGAQSCAWGGGLTKSRVSGGRSGGWGGLSGRRRGGTWDVETTGTIALNLPEGGARELVERIALLEGLAKLFLKAAPCVADVSVCDGDEIGFLCDLCGGLAKAHLLLAAEDQQALMALSKLKALAFEALVMGAHLGRALCGYCVTTGILSVLVGEALGVVAGRVKAIRFAPIVGGLYGGAARVEVCRRKGFIELCVNRRHGKHRESSDQDMDRDLLHAEVSCCWVVWLDVANAGV